MTEPQPTNEQRLARALRETAIANFGPDVPIPPYPSMSSSVTADHGRRWLLPLVAATAVVVLGSGVAALAVTERGSSRPANSPAATNSNSPTGVADLTSGAATPSQPAPTTSSSPATSPPTPSSSPDATDVCQTQNLKLSFASANGAGGTAYSAGYLTNVGTTTCTMFGYPGVAGLDASGNIVQHPANRNPDLPPNEPSQTPELVTLPPGARALFGLTSVDTTPNPDCSTTFPITQMQVYPPNQTTPIRVASDGISFGGGICDLAVGFVRADS